MSVLCYGQSSYLQQMQDLAQTAPVEFVGRAAANTDNTTYTHMDLEAAAALQPFDWRTAAAYERDIEARVPGDHPSPGSGETLAMTGGGSAAEIDEDLAAVRELLRDPELLRGTTDVPKPLIEACLYGTPSRGAHIATRGSSDDDNDQPPAAERPVCIARTGRVLELRQANLAYVRHYHLKKSLLRHSCRVLCRVLKLYGRLLWTLGCHCRLAIIVNRALRKDTANASNIDFCGSDERVRRVEALLVAGVPRAAAQLRKAAQADTHIQTVLLPRTRAAHGAMAEMDMALRVAGTRNPLELAALHSQSRGVQNELDALDHLDEFLASMLAAARLQLALARMYARALHVLLGDATRLRACAEADKCVLVVSHEALALLGDVFGAARERVLAELQYMLAAMRADSAKMPADEPLSVAALLTALEGCGTADMGAWEAPCAADFAASPPVSAGEPGPDAMDCAPDNFAAAMPMPMPPFAPHMGPPPPPYFAPGPFMPGQGSPMGLMPPIFMPMPPLPHPQMMHPQMAPPLPPQELVYPESHPLLDPEVLRQMTPEMLLQLNDYLLRQANPHAPPESMRPQIPPGFANAPPLPGVPYYAPPGAGAAPQYAVTAQGAVVPIVYPGFGAHALAPGVAGGLPVPVAPRYGTTLGSGSGPCVLAVPRDMARFRVVDVVDGHARGVYEGAFNTGRGLLEPLPYAMDVVEAQKYVTARHVAAHVARKAAAAAAEEVSAVARVQFEALGEVEVLAAEEPEQADENVFTPQEQVSGTPLVPPQESTEASTGADFDVDGGGATPRLNFSTTEDASHTDDDPEKDFAGVNVDVILSDFGPAEVSGDEPTAAEKEAVQRALAHASHESSNLASDGSVAGAGSGVSAISPTVPLDSQPQDCDYAIVSSSSSAGEGFGDFGGSHASEEGAAAAAPRAEPQFHDSTDFSTSFLTDPGASTTETSTAADDKSAAALFASLGLEWSATDSSAVDVDYSAHADSAPLFYGDNSYAALSQDDFCVGEDVPMDDFE